MGRGRPFVSGRSGVGSSGQPSATPSGVQTRICIVRADEARGKPNLILGTLFIFGRPVCVVIDTGANRSYVSTTYALHASCPLVPLRPTIVVNTPLREQLVRDSVFANNDVVVAGYVLEADLILLEMWDLDSILRMDWLSYHRASVDYFDKIVTFHKPGMEEIIFERERRVLPNCIISAFEARRLMHKGCQAYLANVVAVTPLEISIDNVPVVCEFVDVFPEELPGMPPDRELEFCIDVYPGTTPISIPPYRMAPAELRELKVQLQELL